MYVRRKKIILICIIIILFVYILCSDIVFKHLKSATVFNRKIEYTSNSSKLTDKNANIFNRDITINEVSIL